MSRGLKFERITPLGPYAGRIVYRNHLTGAYSSIFLRVDAAPPHRILALSPLTDLHEPLPGAPEPAVAPHHLTEREVVARLAAFMNRLFRAEVFSGVVVLARDGVPVFQHAYGEADRAEGVPNGLETEFEMASMGKMFTAVAIAQLVERGKLSYDDSLEKFFLPRFLPSTDASEIKVKHLLSHTSGLPMWWKPQAVTTFQGPPKSVDQLLETIAPLNSLAFKPGTGYQYSNLGYVLLGKIIEQVSGMSYGDYVRKFIFQPAGMTDTNPSGPLKGRPVAHGYVKTFDSDGNPLFRQTLHPSGSGSADGGGYGTANDLVKFITALRSGKLLEPADVRLLMTAKPELGAREYGYGFDVHSAQAIAGHGGGTFGASDNLDTFLRSHWRLFCPTIPRTLGKIASQWSMSSAPS